MRVVTSRTIVGRAPATFVAVATLVAAGLARGADLGAISGDGARVVTTEPGSTVLTWNVETRLVTGRLKLQPGSPFFGVRMTPDGQRVVIGTGHNDDGKPTARLEVWTSDLEKKTLTIPDRRIAFVDVGFDVTDDGRWLGSVSSSGEFQLHDLRSGLRARSFPIPRSQSPHWIRLARDASAVLVDGPSGYTVLDVASGRTRSTFRLLRENGEGHSNQLVWTIGSGVGQVEFTNRLRVGELRGDFARSLGNLALAAMDTGEEIQIRTVDDGTPVRVLRLPKSSSPFAVSAAGDLVAYESKTTPGTLRVFDARIGRHLPAPSLAYKSFGGLRFSANGRHLLLQTKEGWAVWHLRTEARCTHLTPPKVEVGRR